MSWGNNGVNSSFIDLVDLDDPDVVNFRRNGIHPSTSLHASAAAAAPSRPYREVINLISSDEEDEPAEKTSPPRSAVGASSTPGSVSRQARAAKKDAEESRAAKRIKFGNITVKKEFTQEPAAFGALDDADIQEIRESSSSSCSNSPAPNGDKPALSNIGGVNASTDAVVRKTNIPGSGTCGNHNNNSSNSSDRNLNLSEIASKGLAMKRDSSGDAKDKSKKKKGATESDDEDLDIEFVGGNTTVMTDLPHSRETCPMHPFTRVPVGGKKDLLTPEMIDANMKHCHNCYCYVCDIKAPDCAQWGALHCHASMKDPFYQGLRAERKAMNNAITAMMQTARDRSSFLQSFSKEIREARKREGDLNAYATSYCSPCSESEALVTRIIRMLWSSISVNAKMTPEDRRKVFLEATALLGFEYINLLRTRNTRVWEVLSLVFGHPCCISAVRDFFRSKYTATAGLYHQVRQFGDEKAIFNIRDADLALYLSTKNNGRTPIPQPLRAFMAPALVISDQYQQLHSISAYSSISADIIKCCIQRGTRQSWLFATEMMLFKTHQVSDFSLHMPQFKNYSIEVIMFLNYFMKQCFLLLDKDHPDAVQFQTVFEYAAAPLIREVDALSDNAAVKLPPPPPTVKKYAGSVVLRAWALLLNSFAVALLDFYLDYQQSLPQSVGAAAGDAGQPETVERNWDTAVKSIVKYMGEPSLMCRDTTTGAPSTAIDFPAMCSVYIVWATASLVGLACSNTLFGTSKAAPLGSSSITFTAPERPFAPYTGHFITMNRTPTVVLLLNCVFETLDRTDRACAVLLDISGGVFFGSYGNFQSELHSKYISDRVKTELLTPFSPIYSYVTIDLLAQWMRWPEVTNEHYDKDLITFLQFLKKYGFQSKVILNGFHTVVGSASGGEPRVLSTEWGKSAGDIELAYMKLTCHRQVMAVVGTGVVRELDSRDCLLTLENAIKAVCAGAGTCKQDEEFLWNVLISTLPLSYHPPRDRATMHCVDPLMTLVKRLLVCIPVEDEDASPVAHAERRHKKRLESIVRELMQAENCESVVVPSPLQNRLWNDYWRPIYLVVDEPTHTKVFHRVTLHKWDVLRNRVMQGTWSIENTLAGIDGMHEWEMDLVASTHDNALDPLVVFVMKENLAEVEKYLDSNMVSCKSALYHLLHFASVEWVKAGALQMQPTLVLFTREWGGNKPPQLNRNGRLTTIPKATPEESVVRAEVASEVVKYLQQFSSPASTLPSNVEKLLLSCAAAGLENVVCDIVSRLHGRNDHLHTIAFNILEHSASSYDFSQVFLALVHRHGHLFYHRVKPTTFAVILKGVLFDAPDLPPSSRVSYAHALFKFYDAIDLPSYSYLRQRDLFLAQEQTVLVWLSKFLEEPTASLREMPSLMSNVCVILAKHCSLDTLRELLLELPVIVNKWSPSFYSSKRTYLNTLLTDVSKVYRTLRPLVILNLIHLMSLSGSKIPSASIVTATENSYKDHLRDILDRIPFELSQISSLSAEFGSRIPLPVDIAMYIAWLMKPSVSTGASEAMKLLKNCAKYDEQRDSIYSLLGGNCGGSSSVLLTIITEEKEYEVMAKNLDSMVPAIDSQRQFNGTHLPRKLISAAKDACSVLIKSLGTAAAMTVTQGRSSSGSSSSSFNPLQAIAQFFNMGSVKDVEKAVIAELNDPKSLLRCISPFLTRLFELSCVCENYGEKNDFLQLSMQLAQKINSCYSNAPLAVAFVTMASQKINEKTLSELYTALCDQHGALWNWLVTTRLANTVACESAESSLIAVGNFMVSKSTLKSTIPAVYSTALAAQNYQNQVPTWRQLYLHRCFINRRFGSKTPTEGEILAAEMEIWCCMLPAYLLDPYCLNPTVFSDHRTERMSYDVLPQVRNALSRSPLQVNPAFQYIMKLISLLEPRAVWSFASVAACLNAAKRRSSLAFTVCRRILTNRAYNSLDTLGSLNHVIGLLFHTFTIEGENRTGGDVDMQLYNPEDKQALLEKMKVSPDSEFRIKTFVNTTFMNSNCPLMFTQEQLFSINVLKRKIFGEFCDIDKCTPSEYLPVAFLCQVCRNATDEQREEYISYLCSRVLDLQKFGLDNRAIPTVKRVFDACFQCIRSVCAVMPTSYARYNAIIADVAKAFRPRKTALIKLLPKEL